MKPTKTVTQWLLAIPIMIMVLAIPQQSHAFGENWPWGKCSKCGKQYKHVGTDISATAGKKVVVTASDLRFYAKGYDTTWKNWVVMTDPNSKTSYVVWHLKDVPNFTRGENMTGKKLGKVADLTNTNDHIHIGFRASSPSNLNMAIKGALPQCGHTGLPQFPEYFKDPWKKIKIE